MAGAAAPGGRAVGIDVDDGALAIAARRAAAAGVSATFLHADAGAPPEHGAFDLAVARLLLSHLADPMAVIRAMREAVRPGGVVAVEDLDASTLRAEPPAPALDRLAAVYGATVRAHGGDPTIGPRLQALLEAAGLEAVEGATVANRMPSVEEKLFLVELVDNMRDAILAAGAATAEEVDALRAGVEAAARDPGRTFVQAVMHQVSGRRPAASPPR
jgi:SAM-dependent methyltransferase